MFMELYLISIPEHQFDLIDEQLLLAYVDGKKSGLELLMMHKMTRSKIILFQLQNTNDHNGKKLQRLFAHI